MADYNSSYTGPQIDEGIGLARSMLPGLGITGASVGQFAKVKTVDNNGAPTEWEADTPSGGGGLTQQVAALLMSILNAGVYTSDQSTNLAALSALIISITITQSGTTLVVSGLPDVSSITQSGTTLALA